jgi:diguanylate cyclase (GGDEF)-like protein/PAS domain S-box-containing protein
MQNRADDANRLAYVECTEDFIWSVDLNYGLLTFNRAVQKDFEVNFGTRAAAGKRPEDLLPPAIAANWLPLYTRALSDGPFRTEFTFASGRILDLSLNPIVVNGKAAGVSVLGKDITDQKMAEKARQEAEQKYRFIFDGALGIFQTSLDGRPIVVNPALAHMLGYESPEDYMAIAKDSARDVWVDPFERAKYIELLKEKTSIRGYECRFRRKDGGSIWVALNARLALGADGETVINEGFAEDITDRKRAMDALIEREARLREAEYLALAGSASWDMDTDTTIWSEGLYRITGRDPSTPPPRHSERDRLYTPDSWERVKEAVQHTLATGEPFDLELQMIRQDGALRWARARGVAVRNELGRVYRLAGSLQDITEQKQQEAKIRESEERYRATFEQAAVGIVHASFEGRFLRCNARFAEIVGYPLDEVSGMTFEQITSAEDIAASAHAMRQVRNGSVSETWEKRYLRKDGSFIWVKVTTSALHDHEGRPIHYISVVQDINARKAAEDSLAAAQETLRVSEARYRTVFQTSLDGIAISRMDDGRYIDVNQALLNILKYEREEVIGRTSTELGLWPDEGTRRNLMDLLRRDSCFRDLAVPFRRKNGENFWMQVSASLIEIDGVTCVLSAIRDTSEIRAAEERIKELAFYDPLTNLPNRRLLLDRLQLGIGPDTRNPPRRALLFIDLDEFKKLNDTVGHQMGDLLLKDVAVRLTGCVRGSDTVARCGGDEFAVILEGLSGASDEASAQAMIVAEKILSALSQPYVIEGREFHKTASIGIVVFGGQPETAHDVLQQAEIAMHDAKDEGRKSIRCFTPALQAAVRAFTTLEEEVHQAIKKKEFLLHYQPQVDSSGLIGAEALVRWRHPKRGLLSPNEFIPMAEESGLILPLGGGILEIACAQIAAWANPNQIIPLVVAVNISARQFRQPDFVDQVLAALDRTGASPRNLKLELTESMLVDNIEDVISKMTTLKSHGLSFSLDDFGTGYSSLSYLKRLPLDQLKIDRSFVRDILADITSGAIARTIISLSQAMGFSVIAEGIETEEQREFLASLGCHAFQGFLFSRPLPYEQFERSWLRPPL